MSKSNKVNVYLVGGGIASLSAAVYLIQDAHVDPKKINIFDSAKRMGGSLDAKASKSKQGYIMRGIRMFEKEVFTGTFDLMSKVPSLKTKGKTLRDEYLKFNNKHKTHCESRLLKKGKPVDGESLSLLFKDRLKILKLLITPESRLSNLKIEDYFDGEFFESNFRYEVCTVFAFQTRHSLIEFKRYLLRFIHTFDYLDTLDPVEITPRNQYDSMVSPTIEWLESKGVKFIHDTNITDLEFTEKKGQKTVSKIVYNIKGNKSSIKTTKKDFLFVTIGSMVAGSSNGSMNKAAVLKDKKTHPAWELWENISKNNPEFGKPQVFNSDIKKSSWVAFTITFRGKKFFDLMNEFIDKKITSHGGVTFIDSNWFLSLVLFHEKYFIDQKKSEKLAWGYTLFPEKKGNFVKKKLIDCTGEEILTEIVYQLRLEKHLDEILKEAVCIPSLTPYVTSHFLPRQKGDRPDVIPPNTTNLAFLGQFSEIPNDIVFTVEYSIRSAQIAVKELFHHKKISTPLYKGYTHLNVLWGALKVFLRK